MDQFINRFQEFCEPWTGYKGTYDSNFSPNTIKNISNNQAMKIMTYFIDIWMLFSMNSYAQNLEHFTVETIGKGWKLHPNFDKRPQSGVNGMIRDTDGNIIKWVKNALKALPEDIKQKVTEENITISFLFNSEGKIFYINFYVRAEDKKFMTDKQWLKLYHTIQNMEFDISKFELIDNFEWGSGGMYPISKYLRQQTK